MPHIILEGAGLFDFSEARNIAEPVIKQVAAPQLSTDDYSRYLDLAMLTAAEAALAAPYGRPLFLAPEVPPPVLVDGVAAHFAIQKWDSSPTHPHMPRSAADLRLWDVMLFAGDMSKVALVASESIVEIMSGGGFARIVSLLKNRYHHDDNAWAVDVANGPVLDFLGAIWHAKSAVLLDPDSADDS